MPERRNHLLSLLVGQSTRALPFASLLAACAATSTPTDFDTALGSSGAGGAGGFGGATAVVTGSSGDDFNPACDGLACQQVDCTSKGKPATTVSGLVYDPAGKNPLYNVIVYVPSAPVEPLSPGVTCDQCGVVASGAPLVSTLTGANGSFVLADVPAGEDIPLVLQVGKWRRQITIPSVAACADTPMVDPQTMRLPRNKSEGDMPQIAIATGGADPFECLLQKIGIDDTEFTNDQGAGAVHVFQGAVGYWYPPGVRVAAPTKLASEFWADGALMMKYDMIIDACEGGETPEEKPQAALENHYAYANSGGRLFTTHFHYYWIDPTLVTPTATSPWKSTAQFKSPEGSGPSMPMANVDTSFPKGASFAAWLLHVGASSQLGVLPLLDVRYTVNVANPPSVRWIDIFNPNTQEPSLFHYTFNTPVGASEDRQCGKVLFSDFHVSAEQRYSDVDVFPGSCKPDPMTPQEMALEFMFFDLSACIQDDEQPPDPPK